MYSVKETKEALAFAFSLAEAARKALADGSIGITDVPYLIPAFMAAGPALQGMSNLPRELGDLSNDDALELMQFADSMLPGLVAQDLQRKINAGLRAILAVTELISELKK